MQKWEFCSVAGVRMGGNLLNPFYPCVFSFTELGVKTTDLRGKNEVDNIAKTIAKLGEEGWEMIGVAHSTVPTPDSPHILYFKRPKG